MSKQVADRERSSRAVVDAIHEHRRAIAEALAKRLEPAAARLGKSVPDVGLFLELCAETLKYGTAVLSAASAAHTQEGLDDAGPRGRRDRAEQALRNHLSPLRKTVSGIYGDAGLETFGLWEALPSSIDVLRNYGATVAQALRAHGKSLQPLPTSGGMTLDASAIAALLEPLVKALDESLAEVPKEAQELSSTLIAKNEAMEANDYDFIHIAGVVERLARGAGLAEVADRIRPSSANPGVLIEVPGEERPVEEEVGAPAPAVQPPVRPPELGPGFDPLYPEEPEEVPKKR